MSNWLDDWEANGIPDWARNKHAIEALKVFIKDMYSKHSTVEEQLAVTRAKSFEPFYPRMENNFPGMFERLNKLEEDYKTLRSFERQPTEYFAVKNDEEKVRFRALCADPSNERKHLQIMNEVLGTSVFKIPDVVEEAADISEGI